MKLRTLLGATVGVIASAAAASAQQQVTVGDVGPGASGRILRDALARPHRLIEPDTGWFTLKRGQHENASLIILERTAAIAGDVDGDVIVVGGDLFVRPGAHIGGRAVAIGGGVYPSTLALIAGGFESFRDNTFTLTRTPEGYRLDYASLAEQYAERPLLFPGVYGLRFPSYDRVNGASVVFGPALSFLGGRGTTDLLATYRSDLGKFDPAVRADLRLSRRMRAVISAERGTFSNDAWIWSDFVNSLSVLVFGADTRNYYRADRAEGTLRRRWEWTNTQIEPYVGGIAERAWSVGPGFGERRGPWSITGRTDSLGIFRPNPSIDDGQITSGLIGLDLRWESQQVRLRAENRAEVGRGPVNDQSFVQVTSDVGVSFLTFGEQEYALDVHRVSTPSGGAPPRQRFVYLGGSGTLPFDKLLEQGGDELLLIDQRYSYPLQRVTLGVLGMPTLLLRHRMGSAGLARLPRFDQILGVGVMLTIARAELQFDPSRKKARFSAGFSFSR